MLAMANGCFVSGITLLNQAVQAYKYALLVRTKASLPLDWAKTMRNLAHAHKDMGNNASVKAEAKAADEVDPQ
jgi:hypothetical protein